MNNVMYNPFIVGTGYSTISTTDWDILSRDFVTMLEVNWIQGYLWKIKVCYNAEIQTLLKQKMQDD